MSIENLIRQCAPTIANIKTGSLFPVDYQDKKVIQKEINEFNNSFINKGIILLPLVYRESQVLLYLYRPDRLESDLKDKQCQNILKQCGYSNVSNSASCILQLIKRLKNNTCNKDFPHEIGLFLSYPCEDVQGFIDNHALNYKIVDYWKVYGDEKKAQQIFNQYHSCTNYLCSLFDKGLSLDTLLAMNY